MRNPVDIGRKLEYFLSTGNLVSQTGLDLMQLSTAHCAVPYCDIAVHQSAGQYRTSHSARVAAYPPRYQSYLARCTMAYLE
eukprot:2704344-Rhodomonas_salina.2